MEMTIQRYLLNLISASQNMSEVLAYGYGGYEWLNNMRELLGKSEEMLPKMEAEICIKEMEELDREERYHNHMMNMLYGTEELESAFEERANNKTNRLNRRKQNKKHHKADRKHGKHRELSRKEQDLVHYDVTKGVHGAGVWYSSRGKKVVPVVSKGAKTNRNYYAKKYSQSADLKEKEWFEEMFTGRGDLLHENDDFEEELYRYYEAIREMQEEHKWGYLTDLGEELLEEWMERTLWLEYWIKENMTQYNTAVR